MPSELLSTSSLQIVKKSEHKPMTILRCKVVIVGDACTGKTSFSQVFALGGANFPKTYLMVFFSIPYY